MSSPPPAEPWPSWLDARLGRLAASQQLRSLRPLTPSASGSSVEVAVTQATLRAWLTNAPSVGLDEGGAAASGEGSGSDTPPPHQLLLFSTNDYLGLSTHPAVRAAGAAAAAAYGCGPRASALVAGYTHAHRELESALAALKHTEECLLFPTGFAANASVLQALASSSLPSSSSSAAAIVSDSLNHASIVDGARLAARGGASVALYRHCDVEHARELLCAAAASRRRPLLVTDTLFSMDGDWAPERALLDAAAETGAVAVFDDAHATLVGPPEGAADDDGGCHAGATVLRVGTLSKAVGSQGGFVACSRSMKQLLLSSARGQVYSTALPLPCVAAAAAALRVSAVEPQLRRNLWRHVRSFRDAVARPPPHFRHAPVTVSSPIISLRCGSEADALQAAAALLQAGFHVPAIRPPTVPAGTSRLRVALSAAHSDQQVGDLICQLRAIGVIPQQRSAADGVEHARRRSERRGGSDDDAAAAFTTISRL